MQSVAPREIPQAIQPYTFNAKSNEIEEPLIHDVFHTGTGTWQYVVVDPATSTAAIIDPVLDFDRCSCAVSTQTADSMLSLIAEKGYRVEHILETHAHADHLSAASYLQNRLFKHTGVRPSIGIGSRIPQVQDLFSKVYGIPQEEYLGKFDKLFEDDEVFEIGGMRATAIHLPGHTPDHMGYMIGKNVFCGDSLFMADLGTARCDFPGGNAQDLFKSATKLLNMPEDVKIWTGHDYPAEPRMNPQSWMYVKDHRERNKHVMIGTTEQEFVAMRTQRDKALAAPKLLHPSLQINIRAGHLPNPTSTGRKLLHLPLVVEAGTNF
ncbi:metallo-beta-lactamase domain protein [Rutstroemia sp. NJR-2017a BVV2]|nr:metallo-beta-lactamase domain protein [Rutstroemia sp. NJR-2017a BVV2]